MAKCAGLSIRVSPSHPYNAGRAGLGWGGGRHRENVYAACSDCVVVLVLGDLAVRRHFVRASRGQLSSCFLLSRVHIWSPPMAGPVTVQ